MLLYADLWRHETLLMYVIRRRCPMRFKSLLVVKTPIASSCAKLVRLKNAVHMLQMSMPTVAKLSKSRVLWSSIILLKASAFRLHPPSRGPRRLGWRVSTCCSPAGCGILRDSIRLSVTSMLSPPIGCSRMARLGGSNVILKPGWSSLLMRPSQRRVFEVRVQGMGIGVQCEARTSDRG